MITTLAIITADRPEALERALAGYGDHILASGREVEILVFDDSKSAANRDRNREIVGAFNCRGG